MHIGPLCPSAHVVVNTETEGIPTMIRSFVMSSNSPDGVLFRKSSTNFAMCVAIVVVEFCMSIVIVVEVDGGGGDKNDRIDNKDDSL
jgi:hypothetical protein